MAMEIRDGDGVERHVKATGVGSIADPFIVEHKETSAAAILTAAQAIQAAVEILDNVVSGSEAQVDVVSALPVGTNTIGATTDNGPQWTSVFGVSGARFTSADQSASAASVTDAPSAGQKIVVTDIVVSADTAMRVDLKEETSGTVLASIYLPASGTAQITPRSKLKLATADKKLQVQTSASGNIAVTAFYYSEA